MDGVSLFGECWDGVEKSVMTGGEMCKLEDLSGACKATYHYLRRL